MAARFRTIPVQAIYVSPQERAVETAKPLSAALNIAVTTEPRLSDVDFGEWTGRRFSELREDRAWQEFNSSRSSTPVPGGERFSEVQSRMVSCVESLRQKHADQCVACVSHADPIRTVVMHCLGMDLNAFDRFALEPASVTVVRLDSAGPVLLTINNLINLPCP
jgi:broad specificity phosphatase PhoE